MWEILGTAVLCFVISWLVASYRIQALQVEWDRWREQFGQSYDSLLRRLDRLEGKD